MNKKYSAQKRKIEKHLKRKQQQQQQKRLNFLSFRLPCIENVSFRDMIRF